jgi:hypothetical protein
LFHVLLPFAAYATLAGSAYAARSNVGGALYGVGAAALCRTFGAQRIPTPNPGLTAGYIHCRTFGAGFLIPNRIPILVAALLIPGIV